VVSDVLPLCRDGRRLLGRLLRASLVLRERGTCVWGVLRRNRDEMPTTKSLPALGQVDGPRTRVFPARLASLLSAALVR